MSSAPRPRTRLATVLAAALALVVLGGCASPGAATDDAAATVADQSVPLSELDLAADPRTVEGPSTAVLADRAVEPVTDAPEQSLPVTVASHDLDGDTEVTVASTDRILGLDISGSIAATIFGLGFGDSVVGRDISTTFAGAADLPVITSGGHSVNSEAVLALRPTLIITDGTIGPIDVVLQLREAGIPVVFVETDPSIAGVSELARQVATALGSPATRELLAASLETQITEKVAEIAAVAPTSDGDRVRMLFLYLRGGSGVYYLFGEESGADELIESLGGIDVAGEIGWSGMKPMTDEALVAGDPDLILVMTDGIESAGGVDGLLDTKPAIALTAAGRNRRFVDMADGDILSFGPRTPWVLDALARAIYAPAD
jgi:iron complex transport system substrate-binding protein